MLHFDFAEEPLDRDSPLFLLLLPPLLLLDVLFGLGMTSLSSSTAPCSLSGDESSSARKSSDTYINRLIVLELDCRV